MPRAIGREINNRLNLGGEQAFYKKRGEWFHTLRNFPGILMDSFGYVLFKNEGDYINDPELRINERTHFNRRNNCLGNHPRYKHFDKKQQTTVDQIIIGESNFQDEDRNLPSVSRRRVNIDSIQRNQKHVDHVKRIRNNTCQICAIRIGTEDRSYSEVHHIQPLGEPHNGPDIPGNMICVCPNCHKKLDYLYIRIDNNFITQQNNENHTIHERYIEWHNARFDNLYRRQ
jgi:5-methylcytosine-specific restriction protein A